MNQDVENKSERRSGINDAPVGIETQLRFETLIANISTNFINIPTRDIDREIEAAQKNICQFLGLDISTLWQWKIGSPDQFSLTHLYRPLDGPPILEPLNGPEHFPWSLEQLKAGKYCFFSSMKDAPLEARRDRETLEYFGVKSNLTIPLSVGQGRMLGAVTFNTVKKELVWPEALINRLRLVAQIFANALARKAFEEDLLESEERLSLAADSAEAGLWSLDLSTGTYWATKKSRDLFCFGPDEPVTREKTTKKIHPDDRELVSATLQSVIQSRKAGRVEYRLMLPDGGVRWISSFGHVRIAADGRPSHLMGISVDITDRKNIEFEAKSHCQEMAHMSRAMLLNQLSSSIAHELNQPLGAALANAQVGRKLMTQPNPDQDEIRHIFDDVIEANRRASDIVIRLRGWLKKEDRTLYPCELNVLVEETLNFLRSELKTNKVDVSIVSVPNLPTALCDKIQVQQILVNLLKNAWEASPSQSRELMHIVISLSLVDEIFIAVAIRDDGVGIPPDIIKNLFHPFITTKQDGLGMGLSICRTIINGHKGKIWAENNPDKGATFHFTLPAAKRPVS